MRAWYCRDQWPAARPLAPPPRALELLAASRDGATDADSRAHPAAAELTIL